MIFDIFIGFIASFLVSYFSDVDAAAGFFLFGIIASLIPHIDSLFYHFQQKVVRVHNVPYREWTHYPITYIPLSVAVFLFMSPLHGFVFIAAISFHFARRSFFGPGIIWFWPFTPRRFKILNHTRHHQKHVS